MTEFVKMEKPLILGSGSAIRKTLLDNAGLTFRTIPADIDEEAIRIKLEAEASSPVKIAKVLSDEKALTISRNHMADYVIGSDQILAMDGEIFAKPEGLSGAAERLRILSGKTHQLHAGVSLAHGGNIIWRYAKTVDLTMRTLTGESIENYLRSAGEGVCNSVGAYEYEGLGVQLFSSVEGDYFSLLGLPLLPLLQALREEDVIVS